MKILRRFISRITMRQTEFAFVDKVTNEKVYKWTDKYGNHWLAVHRFGFRIKIK